MGKMSIIGYQSGYRPKFTSAMQAGQIDVRSCNVYTAKNITKIENNFYGAPMMPPMMGLPQPEEPKLSPLGKGLFGLGAVFTVIGGLLGIGSRANDNIDGAGGKEEPTKTDDSVDVTTPENKPSEKAQKEADEVTAIKQEAAKRAAQQPAAPKPDLADGSIIRVRDEKLGPQADISGTVTNNADGTVSIKDKQNTYTYQKTGETVTYNGTEYPLYECIGAKNNATGATRTITSQQYILINGELVQPRDLDLTGTGSGTIAKTGRQSAPPPTRTVQEHKPANNDNNTNTITGQNGYSATKKSDGSWEYKDPNGNIISANAFKQKCPTIYQSTVRDQLNNASRNLASLNQNIAPASSTRVDVQTPVRRASTNNTRTGFTPEQQQKINYARNAANKITSSSKRTEFLNNLNAMLNSPKAVQNMDHNIEFLLKKYEID